MLNDISFCCAFTGHRPQSLPWGFNESDPRCQKLQQLLGAQISSLADRGLTDFLSGMALGVDTWAAQALLLLRQKKPGLKLHCILPCPNQSDRWPAAARQCYKNILDQADSVIYSSSIYHKGCMLERNRFLVENANFLLAVYNGWPYGGTAATLRYAQSLGRKIIVIDPILLKITGVEKL